jgi:hypothetical protein
VARKNGSELPTHVDGVHSLSMMVRYFNGGRQRLLEVIALAVQSGDPLAEKWWAIFSRLKQTQQRTVSIDDVCLSAGIDPAKFLGAIVEQNYRCGEDVTSLVEASFRPEMVHNLARSGLRYESTEEDPLSDEELRVAQKDRHLFLQHSKFLPIPRNATITVTASAGASALAASAASAEPSVPSFADDMRSLEEPKEAIQRELAAQPMPERAVEAEVVE